MFVRLTTGRDAPLKSKLKTRLLIKEVGTDDKDGHFILRFSDGNGPAMTPMEITNLILETLANSMMFLKMLQK